MLGPIYGRENLAAFFAAQVRARATGEPIVIHIVGDSKVAGVGVTDGYRLDQLLTSAANGYPVQISYEGFGGKNSLLWAQTEAADFVAQHADADLLIVDFGTNEGVTGLVQTTAQTKANHISAINRIRLSRSRSSLSILILGQLPCNNDNPIYNQTTANMVAINAVLEEAADETNSAFFDPLEMFTRAHAEAGWMEQLGAGYGDGNVHPGNPLNLVLVGELGRVLFPLVYNAPLSGSASITPAPLNGWVIWAPGNEPKATYENGVVTLSGLVKPHGAVPSELVILFNLPVGYRPSSNRFFAVSTAPGPNPNEVLIRSNGSVYLRSRLRGSYVSLDGISYRVV